MNGQSVRLSTPLSDFREVERIEGASIRDHFDELPPETRAMPVVAVLNGDPVLRRDWGVPLADGDLLRFVVLPLGGNGTAAKIIMVVAVIAIAIAAPHLGFGIASTLGVTSAAGAQAITAGISAIAIAGVGLLVNTLLPPPSVGRSVGREQASPTYTLSAQGNAARLLEPIPRLYGRHILHPDFVSQPYSEFQGNDQYLYQLFGLGLGEYDVEEVRVEDTTVWRSSTGYTDAFDDVQIQIVPPGDSATLFPAAVITSVEVGGQEIASTTEFLGPFVANDAVRNATQLSVDFVFPGGLYYANDDGGLSSNSVTVRADARPIDAAGAAIGPWTTLGTHTYEAATATAQRFTESYPVAPGRYQVRVIRVTPDSTDVRFSDTVQWAGLRAYVPDDQTFFDLTVMAVRIKTTGQLTSQSSRRFNTIQTARVPIRSGGAWAAPTPTRSPAWAALDLLRNTDYGLGLADARIDVAAFEALASTAAGRGDRFDGVFDTKYTAWDALGRILRVARAQPVMVAGVVSVIRDEPVSMVRSMLTPRNSLAGSFEANYILQDEDAPDSVIVEFVDEATWERSEVECVLPGATSNNPARIDMFGVVDRAHAWREGMYQAAANRYRRQVATIDVEYEGRMLIRGDAVAVSHDVPRWGQPNEVAGWDATARRVRLVEPVDGAPTVAGFSDRQGRLFGPVTIESVSSDGMSIVLDADSLSAAGSADFEDGFEEEPTRVALGTSETYAKRFKLLGSRPISEDHIRLSLTVDDDRVYAADAGSPPPAVTALGPGAVLTAPSVFNLSLTVDPESAGDPVTLNASVSPAAGATEYVFQASADGVSWSTVGQSASTSIRYSAPAGSTLYVRAAGIGLTRGPWLQTGPISAGQPDAVNGLAGSQNAGAISASWNASARAESYRVDVISSGSVVMTATTTGTSQTFSSSSVSGAGGPWSPFTLLVTASNALGSSQSSQVVVS